MTCVWAGLTMTWEEESTCDGAGFILSCGIEENCSEAGSMMICGGEVPSGADESVMTCDIESSCKDMGSSVTSGEVAVILGIGEVDIMPCVLLSKILIVVAGV